MPYDPTTQTVTIGLRYIGHESMDQNLRKIDDALAKLGVQPPAEPPAEPAAAPPEAEPPAEPAPTAEAPPHAARSHHRKERSESEPAGDR